MAPDKLENKSKPISTRKYLPTWMNGSIEQDKHQWPLLTSTVKKHAVHQFLPRLLFVFMVHLWGEHVNNFLLLHIQQFWTISSSLLDIASWRGDGSTNTCSVFVVGHGQNDHKTTKKWIIIIWIHTWKPKSFTVNSV